jgi:hypothetical protein
VLYLLQAFNEHKPARTPGLVLATNGVQRVEGEKDVQVTQASLWGFARVVANEWPQYGCKCIDLSACPAPAEIGALVGELLTADADERELVLRGDRQYVSRLAPLRQPHRGPAGKLLPEGTYLVTGFRGLGFVFVEWMFERGARHFALLSRSGKASADTLERLRELEAEGATFACSKPTQATAASSGRPSNASVNGCRPPRGGTRGRPDRTQVAGRTDGRQLLLRDRPQAEGRLEPAPADPRPAAGLLRAVLVGVGPAGAERTGQLRGRQRLPRRPGASTGRAWACPP